MRDAARLRFGKQIALRRVVVARQPEHASFHLLEQPHPDVEDPAGDLVTGVEAAKHETVLGQADRFPCRAFRRDYARPVVDQVTIWKMNDPLGAIGLPDRRSRMIGATQQGLQLGSNTREVETR